MEFKYWLLAVGVVVAMSYVPVKGGEHAACAGENSSNCTANEICNTTTSECACRPAYKDMSGDCVAGGYDDPCTANTDCKSGNLGNNGVCNTTSSKCGCMTGYSWTASMCKSDNGAAGLTISITLMLGALLSKNIF